MTKRRKQTQTGIEHPVRFYKIIAVSFLLITLVLLGVIVFMSSKRATITVLTKAEPVEMTTRVGVNTESAPFKVPGKILSTTVSSTETFQPTGTREEPGIATGEVTLHNDSSIRQPLVATTRLLSPEGVLFRMENAAVVPANGTTTVSVYADKEGASGNIGPSKFSIPGLADARQKQVYARSVTPMTGGITEIGIVDEQDIADAKKRVAATLKKLGAETLTARADTDQTGVFFPSDPMFAVEVEAGEEVSEFSVQGQADVAGIFYAVAELESVMSRAIASRAIDASEVIEPGDAAPSVSVSEYDPQNNTAILDVFYTGKATVSPESKALNKIMFYGKSKDEVRRYLMTLDHVYGAEVEMRPAWVQHVPHVPDHVNIIVKEVE